MSETADRPTRRWLPASWLDEMNPTLLDSPDAFLERDGDTWTLRLPANDPERDNPFYHERLLAGQVVKFAWTESYGELTLTVYHDRSWCTDFAVPEQATHFYEYSTGTLAESIAELVAQTGPSDQLERGQYTVVAYTWADVPFRLEVDDGRARFVQCAGAH